MSLSTKVPGPSLVSDKLQSTLYQYIQLYERWSKDQQEFVAQAEELEAVLDQLSAAAKVMSEFKPQTQVGQAVEESLRRATHKVVEVVLNAVGDLSNRMGELNIILFQAELLLKRYELQMMWSDWKHWITIGLSTVVSGVLVGLLVARLTMPTISVSLTDSEAETLKRGEMFTSVWPLLSPAEQKHYEQLAEQANAKKPGQ